MKKYKRFGSIFKKRLKEKHLTLKKISEKTGISLPTLGHYSRGATVPDDKNKEILSKLLGLIEADFLPDVIAMQGDINLGSVTLSTSAAKRRVPIVSSALAGRLGARGHFEDIANQINDSMETDSRDPNAFAIEISGDSMEPLFFERDCVVFEPNLSPRVGKLVLVKTTDETVLFKKLAKLTESKVILESLNDSADFPTIELNRSEVLWMYPACEVKRRIL